MTKIVGLEGIKSNGEIQQESQPGGKFVSYRYWILLPAMTFKRSPSVYFLIP